jgi:hypothetical protein
LDDRLHFLGAKLVRDSRTAVLLGLFSNEITALRYLRGLPNLLPDPYNQYVVACPSYAPTPVVARELATFRVAIVPLGVVIPWIITIPTHERPSMTKGRRVVLSDAEEEEFQRYGFRFRLPIHISAARAGRNSTVIEIDGVPITLPRVDFRLFMLLVTALFRCEDAYLQWNDIKYSQGELREEPLAPEGLDQALSRLRSRLQSPLAGLKGTEFIERKHWKVRISTHRKYVSYDKDRLLSHSDRVIRYLAQRLP